MEAFLKKHEEKIVLGIAFILVFLMGFFLGRFFVLEKEPFKNPIQITTNQTAKEKIDKDALEEKKEDISKEEKFVGSIDSNKYHLLNCPNAKKIKEKIWFSSEKEAEEKGYQKAKCCFKD